MFSSITILLTASFLPKAVFLILTFFGLAIVAGFLLPALSAKVMAPFGYMAGMIGAFYGLVQVACGAIASFLVAVMGHPSYSKLGIFEVALSCILCLTLLRGMAVEKRA